MSFPAKVYRVLLRAYPRDYRNRYAEPMEQLFRDRLRQVRSFPDLVVFWFRILGDWTVSVPAQYWHAARVPTHLSPLADPARRCLFFARSEASSFSRREITVEHLLLGVLREQPTLVPELALKTMVRTIEAAEPASRRVPPMEDLRLTDEAIRVVAAATGIAHSGGRQVSPADLVKAILREENTLAGSLLRKHVPVQDEHQSNPH